MHLTICFFYIPTSKNKSQNYSVLPRVETNFSAIRLYTLNIITPNWQEMITLKKKKYEYLYYFPNGSCRVRLLHLVNTHT
jgi:hypothetical protein